MKIITFTFSRMSVVERDPLVSYRAWPPLEANLGRDSRLDVDLSEDSLEGNFKQNVSEFVNVLESDGL